MKKVLATLAMLFCLEAFAEEPKQLTFRYSDDIIVGITNEPCVNKAMSSVYPLTAYAVNKAGESLIGCFTHDDNNNILVKWFNGEESKIPADYFLNPEQPKYTPVIPEPTL